MLWGRQFRQTPLLLLLLLLWSRPMFMFMLGHVCCSAVFMLLILLV
jgi:hypothetical protein